MKQTDQTLLEQMQITSLEVNQRMNLFSLTEQDVTLLKQCRPIIDKHLESLVTAFYKVQTGVPEIALLIGDADTLDRLQDAQRGYISDLFSGLYDLDYVNNRLRIGMVHKRIGVEPKLYLSAVHTLKGMLYQVISDNMDDVEQAEATCQAMEKLLMFDVTLVFDTYIRSLLAEIETAKKKSDIYARELEEKVQQRTLELETLSKTDSLTGLQNIRYLMDTLIHALRGAHRREELLSVVYIDLDDLKMINDNEGHQRGDELIRGFAAALQTVSRAEDWCFRYGGDEFCLILPECSKEDALEIYQNRLQAELDRSLPGIHFSVGVAQAGPDQYPTPEVLIGLADKQMYARKKARKAAAKDAQAGSGESSLA